MRGSRIASIVAVAGCIPLALSGAAPAADSGTLIGSDSPGALQSIQPDTIFANFTCPSDAFCLYHDASYRGDIWYSSDASGRYQLSHAPIRSFNDVDSSWINNRSSNVRVYNDWTNGNVSGKYFTAPAHQRSAHLPTLFADEGSGVALYP
ncbi:MAG: Peptidase inhibitor family [Solirubrobacteraceae bacterium]|jgi:hypothetical protein|nr:Peptidase inhibitor family [Solirubrobacteraceae bacterium]